MVVVVGSDVVDLFWVCGFFILWVLWPAVVVRSDVCVVCFGFWGFFFSFGFCGRRWFSVVLVVSSMGWICNGGCYGFLDLQWRML